MSIGDDTIKIKAKYGIGDKLFYIVDGYVSSDIVTAVFKDKWGNIYYSFSTRGERSQLDLGSWHGEWQCFKTKAALLKSL